MYFLNQLIITYFKFISHIEIIFMFKKKKKDTWCYQHLVILINPHVPLEVYIFHWWGQAEKNRPTSTLSLLFFFEIQQPLHSIYGFLGGPMNPTSLPPSIGSLSGVVPPGLLLGWCPGLPCFIWSFPENKPHCESSRACWISVCILLQEHLFVRAKIKVIY